MVLACLDLVAVDRGGDQYMLHGQQSALRVGSPAWRRFGGVRRKKEDGSLNQ